MIIFDASSLHAMAECFVRWKDESLGCYLGSGSCLPPFEGPLGWESISNPCNNREHDAHPKK